MNHARATVDGPTNSPDWISGGNLFIPISLGNHYYSSAILRELLLEFVAKSRISVIFLCDRLRFLSYRMRGEADIKRINANVAIQLDQITRALVNVGLASHSNAIVADWSFLRDDPRYCALLAVLEKLVQADFAVCRKLDDYAARLAQRFRDAASPARDSIELQTRYILEETALCLYMTEIRGFSVEVYRRGMGFVDYLYADRPDHIKDFVGTPVLKRKFISIEDWLARRPIDTAPAVAP